MGCDCSTDLVVIFFGGTLTEKRSRVCRGHRGILAISPFKNSGWGSYFRFLPGMMDNCFSECQTDCAQGEQLAWSTLFLPRDCKYLRLTPTSLCFLAEDLFFCASLSLPSPRWFFPLLLDSLIFLSVENELVQRVHCMGLIVLLSQR